jgi:hypothetical protein
MRCARPSSRRATRPSGFTLLELLALLVAAAALMVALFSMYKIYDSARPGECLERKVEVLNIWSNWREMTDPKLQKEWCVIYRGLAVEWNKQCSDVVEALPVPECK